MVFASNVICLVILIILVSILQFNGGSIAGRCNQTEPRSCFRSDKSGLPEVGSDKHSEVGCCWEDVPCQSNESML